MELEKNPKQTVWAEQTSDIHLVFPVQGNFSPALSRPQDYTGYAPQPTNGQGQREISPETSTPAPRKVCLNFIHKPVPFYCPNFPA